jgi:hypothetical protein
MTDVVTVERIGRSGELALDPEGVPGSHAWT